MKAKTRMNRKMTYRLDKMHDWARDNRMSSSRLPFSIVQARWAYRKGDRSEKMENHIYKLYDIFKEAVASKETIHG